ncbi:MAG TPA: DUF2726 domain-containing protein [Nitrospira sp.]|nr:DUF2726 domain-containing protein [Nitrospira sp.]
MLETMLAGAGALLVLISWVLIRSMKVDRHPGAVALPAGVAIVAAPLLTEPEVALYNLIRMTVQEHYLVLAHVPLWSFVSVEAMGTARSKVLSHMALKRVDFALVHPGSRRVEQVVQLETSSSRPHQAERRRVIQSVLDAAGIKLVTLRPDMAYTIPDLARILDLDPDE